MKKGIKFAICLLSCLMIFSADVLSAKAAAPVAVAHVHQEKGSQVPVCDHNKNMYLAFSSAEYVYYYENLTMGGWHWRRNYIGRNDVYRCPLCGYERVDFKHVRYQCTEPVYY